MEEKIEVDSKRFGRLFYALAYKSTYDELKDEKIFKDLGVGEIDRNYLFTEMLIIKFFQLSLQLTED